MKRFFISAIVTMGCFMAHAQSITIPAVKLAPGVEKNVEVSIPNGTTYTAFQFDINLPAGVTIKKIEEKSGTRNFLGDVVDGKFRVLSYDDKNEKLASSDAVLSLTFAAADDASTGDKEAEVGGIVLVDPEGNQPESVTGGNVAISVGSGASVDIPEGGKTTYVCDKDLDFNGLEDVKAYIATGYDLAEGDIYLTRVMDVPANTPIWVKGPKSKTVTIPEGTSITYYPQNLLVGNATGTNDIPAETDEYLNWTLGKDGSIAKRVDGITGFPAGKAYLHLPKKVASSVGSEALTVELTAKGNKRAYVTPCDLDFEKVEGLKAFAVTAFSKDGTIWLTRVMKASANTPLYLKGEKESYSVPTTEVKMSLVNMLKGDATNATALKTVDGEFTTCVLSKGDGVFNPLGSDVASFPAGTAYLPLPTSYIKPASSRGVGVSGTLVFSDSEAEVEVVKIIGLGGADEATGISRIATEVDNDVWYNLKGQRIDAPTRKGLYIKNGQKVVVK